MYDLNEVLDECKEELDAIGVPYGNNISISINDVATCIWGEARHNIFGDYITISKTLVDERNPRESLKQTVMHELLHTSAPYDGHKGKWKAYANKVNEAYGYHITRTNSAENLGIIENDCPKKIKYSFRCKNCGYIITRQKASNFTKNYTKYRCGRCHGELERIF